MAFLMDLVTLCFSLDEFFADSDSDCSEFSIADSLVHAANYKIAIAAMVIFFMFEGLILRLKLKRLPIHLLGRRVHNLDWECILSSNNKFSASQF
jgi:hypothetical protein